MPGRTAVTPKQSAPNPSDALTREIRTLQRLTAMSLIQGQTQADSIRLLARTGLDRNEIAAVVGTSPDAVSVRLAEAKRTTATGSKGKRRATARSKK